MRNALVCWAPECGELVPQPVTGRPRLYCNAAHKMRARRRNGDKPPTEPFPPLEPTTGTDVPPQVRGVIAEPAPISEVGTTTPLQQDATAATVGSGSEQKVREPRGQALSATPGPGRSDADGLGQSRGTRRGAGRTGNVPPPVVATTGKAPAPVLQSPATLPPPPDLVPARTPERVGTHPEDGGFRIVGSGRASRNDPEPPEAKAGGPEGTPDPPAPVTQLHVSVTENATVPVKLTVHPMVAAYKADLQRIGKAGTRQGLQVLEMAEKLVSSATSPAAAANLSKELQRLMDALEEATDDALVNTDPSLVIRNRTLAKLRAIQPEAAEASA